MEHNIIIILGGITGLLGVAISNFFEYLKQSQLNAHHLALEKIPRENFRPIKNNLENQNPNLVKNSSSFKNADKITIWADITRGVIRPLATLILLCSVVITYFLSESELVLNSLLYAKISCVLWWFGTRIKVISSPHNNLGKIPIGAPVSSEKLSIY